MGARFIGMDREQTFLMPPSVRDWVPEGHLVWTVLESVGELDLSAFYAEYRADGHGRPAYEPSMMVALLLYAYARGNRSARGVERACVEDVAFRVAAGNLVPDHSTIAEFRRRHERALAEVFSGVLGLCSRAGLASVGVVAIDGTKMSANAAINSNRDFGQIAREILREADEIDRREDELYGTERGDELPEHLRTREGRRKAFREAKERLQREREAAEPVDDEDAAEVSVELDPDHFVTRPQGRRAWLREGRRGLDAKRERQARPIAQERADRLFEACRRLEEELDVEQASNAAYEAWRARGIAADGSRRMAPGMLKPYQPPVAPTGLINTTDLDSRVVRTHGQPPLQGYNAQAAVNEHQIVVAAEITVDSPDFGHLEPMVNATRRELHRHGLGDPQVVLGPRRSDRRRGARGGVRRDRGRVRVRGDRGGQPPRRARDEGADARSRHVVADACAPRRSADRRAPAATRVGQKSGSAPPRPILAAARSRGGTYRSPRLDPAPAQPRWPVRVLPLRRVRHRFRERSR